MADGRFTVSWSLPGDPVGESASFERPVVAGRGDDCEIRMPHPLVSRRHAELGCTAEGRVTIRDLDSTNGTVVEDELLRSASTTLEGSARVQIGPYAVTVTTQVLPDDTTVFSPVRTAGAVSPREPGDPLPDGLTAREVEVLRLVTRGRSNPEIAEELVLSVNTVTRHVSNIFDKTGATNRVELVRYAFERGLAD